MKYQQKLVIQFPAEVAEAAVALDPLCNVQDYENRVQLIKTTQFVIIYDNK